MKRTDNFPEALCKSIGLLFAIESKVFTIIKYDVPYIYANIGVLEVAYGEIVGKGVEITPMGFEGRCDMPTVDWYVIVFPDKQKRVDEKGNVVGGNVILMKNQDGFKKKWDDAFEFAKHVKNKFWIDI